jgi:hypothetical protein
VPGYRATTGYWIPGFRRSRHRTGYAWITGYWDSGIWVSGFWRPTMSRTGYSYSPGHVGLDGYWVSGFWRRGARSGYMWVDGYYVGDSFVWGFWRPVRVRSGYTWIVGYRNSGVWYSGRWRRSVRAGYYWMPGRYNRGVYVAGTWYRGRAPGLKHVRYAAYRRHLHRMRYHTHHVMYQKAHRGPHYRMSRSKLWKKSAIHRARYNTAMIKRRDTRASSRPYLSRNLRRARSQKRIVRNKLSTIQSRRAGRRVSIKRNVKRLSPKRRIERNRNSRPRVKANRNGSRPSGIASPRVRTERSVRPSGVKAKRLTRLFPRVTPPKSNTKRAT